MNRLPTKQNGPSLILTAAVLKVSRFKSQKIVGTIKVGFGQGAADLIRAVQPAAQINQFASLRAKGAKRVLRVAVQRLQFVANGTRGQVVHG